ncbi:MAG: TonB-dependent receptor domain-containing protein, partial [Prevotella sp.]
QAYDEDLHVTAVGGEGVLIQLADGLKPERSNSFSGSLDWSIQAGHFQINLLAEAFYTSLSHVFYLQNIGYDAQGNSIQERRNGSGANVYGVNFDAKAAHGTNFYVQAGLTLQRSRYKELTTWSEDPDVEAVRDMPRTPNVYGYFTMNLQPVKALDLSLSGVYTGRMHVPHFAPVDVVPEGYEYTYINKDEMVHTPDFFDLSAKVAYTFSLGGRIKLQLNAGVQNILDAFQKDLDKGTYRDSGYFYGPTQPRTVYIGCKVFM